jgi:hypothetical protein
VGKALYQWNSTLAGPIAQAGPLEKELTWAEVRDHAEKAPSWSATIDFPPVAAKILGKEAHLDVGIDPWN